MTDNCEAYDAEKDIYYRHSDHLGSASWVTDFDGAPIQYIHYLPYGQILVNQHMVGYDERYKFTGKERDTETGYDYFGARYYSPSFMHWTSVDPLVDDNPHISPYAYCNWNPLKFVDPDGKLPDAIWDVFWITYDIASVVYDYSSGDNQQVALDVASLSADVGALFIPGLPALAGVGRLASRLGTHVDDAAKVASVSGKGISATRNTYREALKKATGKSGKGYEAHHTLPQKHRDKFEKLGINIDDPRYVVWRKAENHHAGNTEHGDAWDEFFEKNPQYTKEQVLQQRNVIEQQVWPDAPAGETPTN